MSCLLRLLFFCILLAICEKEISSIRISRSFMRHMVISSDKSGEFDPYRDNGGTVLGISGKDFVLVASDTRLSEGYVIHSRNISRIFQLNDGVLLTASGCWSDTVQLVQTLKIKGKQFEWEHDEKLSASGFSTLLSRILYSRRTFPFYVHCLLAGIDSEGHGALYHFDPLGSKERIRASCSGKGGKMIQPFLDEMTSMEEDNSSWVVSKDGSEFISKDENLFADFNKEDAISFALKAYKAAAEREITVGDGVQIWILNKNRELEKHYYLLPIH